MKNPGKDQGHRPGMKSDLTVTFDELGFLEALVEDLADRGYKLGYQQKTVQDGSQAIESSSLEAYVSGKILLPVDDGPPIDLSFTTCFLFSCITAQKDIYKLTWGNSLS
jgi:hypothetical protein